MRLTIKRRHLPKLIGFTALYAVWAYVAMNSLGPNPQIPVRLLFGTGLIVLYTQLLQRLFPREQPNPANSEEPGESEVKP